MLLRLCNLLLEPVIEVRDKFGKIDDVFFAFEPCR